ncbi:MULTISPECIES: hypothetical protein [unclassified Nostoc]|nr:MULTISPECIES: hypothetical protein [unclassified Nostoc]
MRRPQPQPKGKPIQTEPGVVRSTKKNDQADQAPIKKLDEIE